MIGRKASQKHSYVLMKLDYMLDQFDDYGSIDVEELHEFTALFRLLPKEKQYWNDFMLDRAAELFDTHDQPHN